MQIDANNVKIPQFDHESHPLLQYSLIHGRYLRDIDEPLYTPKKIDKSIN